MAVTETFDRTEAYTRSGYRVNNLRKSKYGGWYGEINGVCVTWCFDFTISEVEVYNHIDKRRLRKGELDIVRLPAGFDYLPKWATSEEMAAALSKRK